jgi:DNA-binding NarL/FixJ family response regulator
VLASQPDVQFAARAFRAGANGHLTKDVSSEELIAAVRKVAGGGAYVTPAMAERLALLLRERSPNALHNELSDREFEVFRLIVAGKRNAEIAAALNLSVKTVSTHKSRLLAKLQLDSHAALIKYGMAHQLFDDGAPFY